MHYKILILLFLLSACSQHYFDQPQPVDGQNIYAFPEPFRGIWTDGRDSLIVGKFYFSNIEYKNLSIPYTKADTTAYAIFKNNKVYPYDSLRQQIMGTSQSFEIRNDSIHYSTRDILEVQLGKRAFLRQVGDQFALNVKGENEWWELFLMGVTDQKKVVVTYPNVDLLMSNKIKPILSNSEEDYFEVRWTTEEFQELIQNNIFSDTLLFIDQQN
ncbi:hypothetical protein SAMN04488029_3355 [Reichenbachiella faecimaris]|uniref:DKNYY family protein n=1 Tax=Reichenbachiella faecimaris TaxID=692418 RepID=A0A1W2GL07_REIFA|nr:hypothetical protein [Reichenbachiella faecimaris]SMD37330.1 hypothetical protein SAMN04488029_3355 [Reichenbachiella faecimaris]